MHQELDTKTTTTTTTITTFKKNLGSYVLSREVPWQSSKNKMGFV